MMNRVKELRKLRGLTQEKVADAIGKTKGQISKIENGGLELTAWWLENLAKALSCRPQDIISADDDAAIMLMGTISGSGQITYAKTPATHGRLNEHKHPGSNCEMVSALPERGHRDVMALRVQGDSMLPFLPDGTLVYYNGLLTTGFDIYLGKLCVVQLKDGTSFLKTLLRGYSYNHYNLMSYNAEIIENIEIVWCAKVLFIKQA